MPTSRGARTFPHLPKQDQAEALGNQFPQCHMWPQELEPIRPQCMSIRRQILFHQCCFPPYQCYTLPEYWTVQSKKRKLKATLILLPKYTKLVQMLTRKIKRHLALLNQLPWSGGTDHLLQVLGICAAERYTEGCKSCLSAHVVIPTALPSWTRLNSQPLNP